MGYKSRRMNSRLEKHEVGLRRLNQPAQAGFVLLQTRFQPPAKEF